jgi:hypothetical protein
MSQDEVEVWPLAMLDGRPEDQPLSLLDVDTRSLPGSIFTGELGPEGTPVASELTPSQLTAEHEAIGGVGNAGEL